LQQLRQEYGSDAPQLQVLAPDGNQHAGAASDLLNDMHRMHAALQLAQPACLQAAKIDLLEKACAELDAALQETLQCETRRREAMLETRMAQEACQHAIAATHSLLQAEQHSQPEQHRPSSQNGQNGSVKMEKLREPFEQVLEYAR
jgi:hypothetical protein